MTAPVIASTAELAIGDLRLESGAVLEDVRLAYDVRGELAPDGSNAVLVEHALTGDSHVSDWWGDLVGPGRAIDTNRFFVVCANAIGGCSGTTGPVSPHPRDGRAYGSRFPQVTIRDMVRAEVALADALGIDRWHAVIGGSMGGARALETSLIVPDRVQRTAILAAPAHSDADQIAWGHIQLKAIENDPDFCGGDYLAAGRSPEVGLGIARQVAHLTYRADVELNTRFGAKLQAPADDPQYYRIQSYLDHQAKKLVRRFDAQSYRVLTRALMDHDVRRDRSEDLPTALADAGGDFLVASVNTDRLYSPAQVELLARSLPGEVDYSVVESWAGHDGFLTETEKIGRLLADFLG